MKIIIAGYGFVGRAHHELLKDKHEIIIHDPELGYDANGRNAEAVIVCVSTPARHDGSCEMKNVYEAIDAAPNVPILIKSTISPEGWDMLMDVFPERTIAFSPEFLRAASAVDDLRSMNRLLIGGEGVNVWAKIFNIDTEVADPKELILAKYFRNSFLATKVAFFNQMYDLCRELDIEYKAVAHYTGMDERIGHSHTSITEERGFGGHCFPKDTAAIVKTGQRNNVDLTLIKEAIRYNKSIRSE